MKKKKLNSIYTLFGIALIGYLFLSNSSNPPNDNMGFTGAPPTGNTCSSTQGGCHSGGSGTGDITIVGLPSTILANTLYPITVNVTRTNTDPQRGGFQLVALNASNNNVGTFSNPGASSTTQTSGGRTFFEHNPAKFFGPNTVSYTVDWTSPASGSGVITMYAAGNLADGNSGTTGDAIVTTTAAGTFSAPPPINVTVTGTNVSCFGGNNGSATAMPSGGGGPPYTYVWSNGGNTQTINGLVAGSYSVTVSNAGGGQGVGNITITQPSSPVTVSIANEMDITCISPVGTATAIASGGTPNYSYAWPGGQQGPTGSFTTPGTYTVTVTDNNGCTATATANIGADLTPPFADAGPNKALTCTNNTAVLDGSNSQSGPSITYLWTTTDGNIVSGATTKTPTVDAPGTYTITVTNNANGCTSTDNTSVTANFTPPISVAGPDKSLNCTLTSVQLDGTGSSQGGNFTYLWTGPGIQSGGNTPTPTVNAPGTYCLTVTNTINGCTATDCASVTQNITPPTANAGSAPPLTCTTLQVQLDGTASSQGGNFTYLWTTVNGNIVSGATTLTPIVDEPGTYTITVTNTTNGCTSSASVTVQENVAAPNADAGPSMALNCDNPSVQLDGTNSSQGGNFTYLWTGPGIQSGGNTPTPTVNAAGTYNILVTNTVNGCTSTDATTVTQTPPLSADVPVQVDVECFGENTGSATAEGTGGNGAYTYEWSNGDDTQEITGLAANTYTLTITDDDGCTATASVTITEPEELLANASATGETSAGADDGTATAEPSGGTGNYSYAWSNGENTQSITGLEPGNYTVSVTDANNCTSVETVTVSSFSCAGLTISFSKTNPLCNGNQNGEATALPAGGSAPFSYLWSTGDTEATITGLGAGTYTVTATDANNCEVTGNVTLNNPPVLGLSVTSTTNVDCHGEETGAATVAASGGTPGYTYAWPGGGTGDTQTGLAAGQYTVTATDANGCTKTVQVTISQPPALTANVTATAETSVGANDGTASAPPSGGTSPFTFDWDNGEMTLQVTGLPPGEYCVTVTDANGCTVTGCATVSPFGCGGGSTNTSGQNVSCFGGNDGSASVTATGFEAPVNYAWSNGSTGANIGMLIAGSYTVTVSGADGCTATDTQVITEPDELAVALLSTANVECAGGMTGEISVDGEGGTPGYSFSWPNGETTPTVTDLAEGHYEVTLSDANGCSATLEVEVGVDADTEAPVVLVQNITVELDPDGNASITAEQLDGGTTDNCGSPMLDIDLQNFTCDDLGENTVTLTATDASSNSASETATVMVEDNLPPVITCPDDVVVDDGSCTAVVEYPDPTATDNCAIPMVFLSTGPPSGATFPTGTTEVTWGADDGNGQTAFCTFAVTVENDFAATISFTQPTCNGESGGTATAQPTNGSTPYSYEWSAGGQTTQTATGLTAGVYDCIITDGNACVVIVNVTVTEPAALEINVDLVVNETSPNMDGAISVTVANAQGGLTYEWLLNGEFFSNEEDLTGLAAGEYTLVAMDGNGCSMETTVTVDLVNSTAEEGLAGQVTLFPNPVGNQLHVRFELSQISKVSIALLDLTGRPALPELRETLSERTLTLDTVGLAAGVYFCRMVVEDGVVVKRVVVK